MHVQPQRPRYCQNCGECRVWNRRSGLHVCVSCSFDARLRERYGHGECADRLICFLEGVNVHDRLTAHEKRCELYASTFKKTMEKMMTSNPIDFRVLALESCEATLEDFGITVGEIR